MVQRTKKQCSIDGCEKPMQARGWCHLHYKRWQVHADPLGGRRSYKSPEEAFAARTEWQGNCLIWTGSDCGLGYGKMRVNGKSVFVHRYAWERSNSSIPEGMEIDHTCYRRDCVNVDHLRLATRKQNNSNLSGPNSNSSTGYRNVYKKTKGYIVSVGKHGRQHHFGTYPTIEEAAKVAEQARKELFGEFAGRG